MPNPVKREPFTPTPEQAEQLADNLFGGDGSEPYPQWFLALDADDQISAVIAAETFTAPWCSHPSDRKRRTDELRQYWH